MCVLCAHVYDTYVLYTLCSSISLKIIMITIYRILNHKVASLQKNNYFSV